MGVLGPKRVVVSDPIPTPAGPYHTVDNEFGVLDKSDLVMIDPVGTGISHAVCDHHDEEFWGVDPDIDSISPLHCAVCERQRALELAEVPAG